MPVHKVVTCKPSDVFLQAFHSLCPYNCRAGASHNHTACLAAHVDT